ncbi:GlsB/YeaQ/YmgE family stress response membrane protein [Micromonospora sp. NPDC049366]|uniref:GlsB/YeaQ/YmgE family stress response membrane protein n=1 Tax=Micromonospora sp. NPDC049366 TaxID=3364271 RepID=UPI00378D501B
MTPPHSTPAPMGDPSQPTGDPSLLQRRYRRLLVAYPRDYRSRREEEIVGTYLDLADPRRRWPSPQDALDLARAGLRERLRGYGALGLIAALPLAATLALNTLVTLSTFLLLQVEVSDPGAGGSATVGPVQTVGAIGWIGWLLAGLTVTALPRRWARPVATGSLLLTVLAAAVAALVGLPRPPLFVLVSVVALGVTTLALPAGPGRTRRVLPPVAAGLGVAVSASFDAAERGGDWFTSYRSTPEILAMAGGLLAAVALLVGLIGAVRADDRGLWAVLVVATPAGLLGADQLSQAVWGTSSGDPSALMFAATVAAIVLTGAVLVAAVVTGRAARQRARRAAIRPPSVY